MNFKTVLFPSIAVSALAIGLTSCASNPPAQQNTSTAPVYNTVQNAPATPAQAQSANRGIKLEKEECEAKALEQAASLRESGNALSENESFGVNMALLDARSKLAQQLETMINGMSRRFAEQYAKGQAGSSYAGKETQIQQGYFEQFLTNTRSICKNTYVKEDGRYNVYVAIELGEPEQKAMYNQLKKDEKLAIDFDEHLFLKEMQAAKEDYRKQKEAQ
jgi:cytochrome c1